MAQQGWNVHYLIPQIKENEKFSNEQIHLIPTLFLKFYRESRSLLSKLNPEYVHFLNPEFKAMCLSMFNRQSKIIGDWEDWHAISRDRGIRKFVTRFSDSYMRKRANVVLVTSRWLEKAFQEICNAQPNYIPYAVLPRKFPKLPNPFPKPTVVFMGSFHKHWDHDILLSAILELKQMGHVPPVRMIGSGADWNNSREFCRRHGLSNVELTGYLDWDEMLNNLQWAHVLAFPIRDKVANRSRCPFKVIQYAQSKRPIITNRVGEVPTFLNDKAHYIDCTPSAFAHEILRTLKLPRQPDIDYNIETHNWEDRTNLLLQAICNTRDF